MSLSNKGTVSERAANFPAASIKIGNWQRISRHDGDIIAKIYFAKRRVVYEVLEGNLKYKIEFSWCDISAIRATLLDSQPGTLEIELSNPPSYYRETNPQPRRHTVWQKTNDFTGGEAPLWRRHTASFKTGILNRHYERLMRYNKRLFDMSQQPFPSHENPYFDPLMSLHINRPYGSFNLQGLQYPLFPVTNYANVGGNSNGNDLITHQPQPQPQPQAINMGYLKDLESFLLDVDVQSNVPANVGSLPEPTDVINPVNSSENDSTTGSQYPYAADQMLQDSDPITNWFYSQQPADWNVPPQQSSDNYVEEPQQYAYEGSSSHAPCYDPENNPTGGGYF